MRRHAKASSAGSIFGTGSSRSRFGRAFATRGGSSDAKGSGAPARRLLLTLTVACLVALFLVPGAQAGKVPGFGKIGTGTVGSGAGQLGKVPRGVAVNTTGAGGASPGDVYVNDTLNNRVSQFSGSGGSGAFIRSFGLDVVPSGQPDNADEVQRVAVNAAAGTFRLTFGSTGTKTTGATGTADTTESSTTVENVVTSTGAFVQGEAITGSGIPAGTTIAAVGAGTLTLSQAATATTAAVPLTADLPHNASASLVQNALNALTTVNTGGGSVAVTGGPGDATGSTPYVITFSGGPLKGTDVAQMTGAAGFLALSGGTGAGGDEAKVTTSNAGNTGYEICNVAANPGEICKAGSEGVAAGGLAASQGIAVDPATGNVFVTNDGAATGKRINVYSATGKFQGAFGWKVNAAAPEEKLQFCTFVTGCAAASSGGGAGQFGEMAGFGNQGSSPAVSPLNAHLLVPEPGNKRVSEFSLTLNGSQEVTGVSFVKAFGGDVIPTINERQTVTVTGASGGTFALGFNSKSTDVTGLGDIEAGSNEIGNLTTTSGTFVVGEEVTGPGIPAGTRITAVTFDSLTLTAAATGTHPGASLTAALPYDAAATVVQAALRALPGIGSTGATVTGANGGPWTVELTGPLAGLNVAPLTGDATKLSGASPSLGITTVQDGANGSETGFETCTVATTCKAGVQGSGAGTFANSTPTSLAIDSTGAIYTAGQTSEGVGCPDLCGVRKFSSEGLSPAPFAPTVLNSVASALSASNAAKWVAIDPSNDHILVAKKVSATTFKLYELTRAGGFIDSSPPSVNGAPIIHNSFGPQGLAIGTAGRAYVAYQETGFVGIFGTPPAPKASIDPVSSATQTSVTLTGIGQPSAPGSEGGFATVAYFEYSADGVIWESTEPFEIGTGVGSGSPNSCPTGNPPSCNVSQTITGLDAGQGYVARMVVSNGTAATSSTTSFETSGAAPGVSRMGSTAVGQTSATLTGEINPRNKPTTYHFEWGEDESYGKRIPAEIDQVAGSGAQPVQASTAISGLQPNTTYHFRIVAGSANGTTSGPDAELTTLNAAGLPNNRGIELVSPADKRPAGTVYIVGSAAQVSFQATDQGDTVAYPLLNGAGDEATGGGSLEYMARRTSVGWTSAQLTPPSLVSPPQGSATNSGQVRYLDREDGKCAIVESYNPLTEDTPAADIANGVYNLYRWTAADNDYTLITNRVPLNPDLSRGQYFEVAGATRDCSTVLFRAKPETSVAYRYLVSSTELYEWEEGSLFRDAGVRPDGSVPAEPVGAEVVKDEHSISPDGRIFFTATSNAGLSSGKQAVFVRKSATEVVSSSERVVNASESKTATPPQPVRYQGASPDGSHVFFLANYGLTAQSSSGPADGSCVGSGSDIKNVACALYSYDVGTGHLTEISLDQNPRDTNGPVVQGLVAVSEDGSTVYFAARGQLVSGEGNSYLQNLQGEGAASLYRWHDGTLTYIAPLTSSDLGGALMQTRKKWVAQTTEDGDFLLFVSRANIAGGNPANTSQAYLYSTPSDSLACISCPAAGSLPKSYPAESDVIVSVVAPVLPGEEQANGRPRSLSEGGRAIFTSYAPLAPGAVENQPNIYEWYRGQVGLLVTGNAKFQDMGGPDGRDVFISSDDQLVPQDFDRAADLYDFRSGGGFAPPVQPPPGCDPALDQCQGQPAPPPTPPASGSSGFVGSGNPTAVRPKQCKKGQQLKKSKCVAKKRKRRHSHRNSGSAQRLHDRAANSNRGGAK